MLSFKNNGAEFMFSKIIKMSVTLIFITIIIPSFCNSATEPCEPKGFASGQEAVDAFIKAIKDNDNNEVMKIFGDDANELINSGDPIADKERRKIFIEAYDTKHKIEPDGNDYILVVGKNEWPFPIPLIKNGEQWQFDTEEGKEEIIDRRVGFNELTAIQVMLAIVDAEREYAKEKHDSSGLHVYAQKFKSDPNTENGLFWETKQGEKPSPLGPLVSSGRRAGYFKETESNEPQPYYGYYYKILKGQGENASDGAYDYIVNGKMLGGFAIVAWPADYGNSGVMTFIVNHQGVVYQKDLGENTEKEAEDMKLYDPDKTWTKAE